MKRLVAWQNQRNMGDMLSRLIIGKLLKERIQVINMPDNQPHIVGIGSIIQHANKYSTIIGAGIGSIRQKVNQQAETIAVRGEYTRLKTNNRQAILGDPALLLPLWYSMQEEKIHEVSVAAHYVDYAFAKQIYPHHNVINIIRDNPLDVVKEICQSKLIISTSLHGLVVAHAYGIPAMWVEISNNLGGDGTKFFDYYSALNDQPKKQFKTYETQVYNIQQQYLQRFK